MKLEYAIFYTRDIERISKFYGEFMGLKQVSSDSNFISFNLGNSLLGIKLADKEREIVGAQTIILSVDDLNNWYGKMKDAGITFYKEISDNGWGRNFAVLDPDLNKVEFVEK